MARKLIRIIFVARRKCGGVKPYDCVAVTMAWRLANGGNDGSISNMAGISNGCA